MTYRAWNLKPLDRAALRELTQAIAEQATEELEYNAQDDEPWSEQKYAAVLAAQQKENALLAGVLTARGITDPTEALTLLAGEEEVSELEELMTSLEQLKCKDIYTAVQKITPELKSASEKGLLYYTKLPEPLPNVKREYEYRHEPADLFKALYAVITRGGKPAEPEFARRLAPTRIVYEIRTKSSELIARLQSGPAKLSELYSACRSRSEIVATFMSILELCSMGSVELSGDESDYTLSFTGGNVNEILDRIVE